MSADRNDDATPHDIDISVFAGELLRVVRHPEAPAAPRRKRAPRRAKDPVLDSRREALTREEEDRLLRIWRDLEALQNALRLAASAAPREHREGAWEFFFAARGIYQEAMRIADPLATHGNMADRTARRDARIEECHARFLEKERAYREANGKSGAERRARGVRGRQANAIEAIVARGGKGR